MRAKRIWKLYIRIWSETFKIAVKFLLHFTIARIAQVREWLFFAAPPNKNNSRCFRECRRRERRKLESKQNLVKNFHNCCKITCISRKFGIQTTKRSQDCCKITCITSRLCQSHRLANGCFLPRLPPKTIHGNFASADGARKENMGSRQQNLLEKCKSL